MALMHFHWSQLNGLTPIGMVGGTINPLVLQESMIFPKTQHNGATLTTMAGVITKPMGHLR